MCKAKRRHFALEIVKLATSLEDIFKYKSSAFYKLVKQECEDVITAEKATIPPGADGRPAAVTFPHAAAALFSALQQPVPALDPAVGDKWSHWIPRPRIAPPLGGALGSPFLATEIWWILYGPGHLHPPLPCETQARTGTICPRCAEDLAQHVAATAGTMGAAG